MDTVTYAPGTVPHELSKEIYKARAHQFIDRLRWDLCVEKYGGEMDQFDDAHAYYVVVREHGKHILSCRIRSARSGTMIEECFSDALPFAKEFIPLHRGSLWEVTRFCKCPEASPMKSAIALRAMSFELDGFQDYIGATGFVAVVYPHFSRFLQRLGVRFLRLSDGVINDERVQFICVTHSVDFRDRMESDHKAASASQNGVSFAFDRVA